MKQINTALCSFGMSGLMFHAPFIHAHRGFKLYGIWERSVKKAAEKYPDIISFDSIDTMLADDNIELVIVNTPIYTHYEFAKKALEAGKHVLVEKAFTVTVAEAEELAMLAKKQNRQLCIFQNRRYDSDFKTVKRIVEEGRLGDIKEVEFHYDRFNLELSPKIHKEDGNAGAGILHDLGPHLADQVLFLFGMPAGVFGSLRITRRGSLVNDYLDAMLFYQEFIVRLKAGFIVKEIPYSFILHGNNGSFLKARADVQEDELKAGKLPGGNDWGTEALSAMGLLVTDQSGETCRENIVSEQGNYMEFFNELFEAIRKNKAVPVTAEEGIKVMKLLEAIALSSDTKKIISVS